jgi:hypothetical protein
MNGFAWRNPVPYTVGGKSSPRFRGNSLTGGLMARHPFTPQELDELRNLAAQWGQIVSRRAFGDAGPGLEVDFATMEQIAVAAAAGLTEGTLQTFLHQQAEALGEQQPCPACGRDCALRRQPRMLQTQGTPLQQDEPIAHCPDCRRDFFPPTADPPP